LKNEGFSCIGLELTTQSIPLETFKHQAFEKIALVLGNERHGIDQRILEQLDYLTYIPMHGKNSSMNVSQAAAIAAYQLLNAPKYER
ncbi:MAG: TrmH family RNA methyltransferase, partial [Bacteroidota bacterium]|nr:TrmH family RNA methyltransferase [Bacteroidota bacterium]